MRHSSILLALAALALPAAAEPRDQGCLSTPTCALGPQAPDLLSQVEPHGPATLSFERATCTIRLADRSGTLVEWRGVCERERERER